MSQGPTISTRRGTMQQQGLTTPVTPSFNNASNEAFKGEADVNRIVHKGEGRTGDQFCNNLTKLLQSRTNALSPTTPRVEPTEYSGDSSPEKSKDHGTSADNNDLEKQRSESSSSLMNVLQAAQILAAASAAPSLRLPPANRNQGTTKKPGQLGTGTPPLQSIVNEEITDYYQLLRNGQITASIVRQVFQTVTVPLDLDPTSPFAVSQHTTGANYAQPANVFVRFQNLSQRYGENFETLYAELQNRRSTLGIGKPIWEKLARREYVDLAQFHPDRLLLGSNQPNTVPDSVDASASAASQSAFPMTAGIAGPTRSSASQVPRELRTYPGWARAWNRYTQARTTLFADDLAQLRKYQELILGWAEQFQWTAILRFDAARRGYHASDPRDLLTTDVPAIRMSYLGTPDVRLKVDGAEDDLGTANQWRPPLTAANQQQVGAQQATGHPQSQQIGAYGQQQPQSAVVSAAQASVQNQFDASGQQQMQRPFNPQQQFQQQVGGFQNGMQQAVPQTPVGQPSIAGRPVNNFSNFGQQSNLPPLPPNLNHALVPPVPAHVQQALSQQQQFGATNPNVPRSGGPLRITTSNGQTKDIQVCGEFNARRGCTRKHCVYLHQCTGCGNPDHGRVNCPRNGPRSAPHSVNPYPIPMVRPMVNPSGPANNMMNNQMFPQQMQNQQGQLPMQQQQGYVGQQQQQPGQMMQPQQGFNNANQGMQQNFGAQNGQQQQLQNGILQQSDPQQQQFFQGMQPSQQPGQGGFQQQQPGAQPNHTQPFYQGYQGQQQPLQQQAAQQQPQPQQQVQQFGSQSQQKLSPQVQLAQAGYAPQQPQTSMYGSGAPGPSSAYPNVGFVGTTSVAQQAQNFQALDAQSKLPSQSQQAANQQKGQGEPSPRLANQVQHGAGGGASQQNAPSQGNESVWRLLQQQ